MVEDETFKEKQFKEFEARMRKREAEEAEKAKREAEKFSTEYLKRTGRLK